MGVVLFLGISVLLARFLQVENVERDADLALIQSETKGDAAAMIAFTVARQTDNPTNLTGQSMTLPPAPATYHDDIDAAPTGSADDKTAPPTTGN